MKGVRLVVCDLAGTTVRDGGEVAEAFTDALAAYGIPLPEGELSRVRGASKREAVSRLAPANPDAVYATFRERLAERYRAGVEAVAGAEEVFGWLRARGVLVALNTGFDREITTQLVDALGWGGLVDTVVCGDDVTAGRPAPDLILKVMAVLGVRDPAEVMAVGDTVLDLQAGQRAGVGWNVGVLSGAHSREVLETAPHTHLIASVAALPALEGAWQ